MLWHLFDGCRENTPVNLMNCKMSRFYLQVWCSRAEVSKRAVRFTPVDPIQPVHKSHIQAGASIGGNDLLQLTLGVDRDSDKITYLSNDKNISYRKIKIII